MHSSMTSRLDRYLLREILGPLALGLLVYTLILLVQQFFDFAEMIIRRGLPLATVGRLLAYSLPSIIVLTLPMALLLGVLLGIGRMASDSELIALRASGVSLYRLVRPVLLLSVALAALNTWLMIEVLPRGNKALSRLLIEVATQTLGSQFEPRVFYNEFQGKVLYVFDAPPRGGDWEGVFLADAVPAGVPRTDVVIARSGRLELADNGEQVVLRLNDAVQHTFDFARPDRYETRRYEKLRLVLRDRFASEQRERLLARQDPRSLDWGELSRLATDPGQSAEQRALARVNQHKRLSIPAACVVLGLLALPLAFNNRRGGKSSGFALSIGIVVLYHVLITQGEEAARLGKLGPALAMWLPNLVLAALGVLLIYLRNRDRSLLGMVRRPAWAAAPIARLAASWRRRAARRSAPSPATGPGRRAPRPEAAEDAARVVVRLPRLRLRFPNLVDRYVLRRFAFVFALVMVSGIALRIVADFTENVDDILRHRPPAATLVRYYEYQALQMAFDTAPLAVLVTTLVTFSLLARTNEITACRALGISLYRLALPALAGAALVAAGSTFLQAQVLPASNHKVQEAKDRIKGRPSQRALRSADKQWMLGQGRFMYNFLAYDERRSALQRMQVFEFDDDHQLVARLYANEATHDAQGWVMRDGWARTFLGREQIDFRQLPEPVRLDLPEQPSFFAAEPRRPAQMSFGELAEYVAELRESGQPQPKYEVALQNKVAFPVASVVMALVGLPFAFRLQRRGALYGLGISIILGMVFLAVYAFFSKLGEVGALPSVVAVWSPSLLFALLSGYWFLGVRS
jgi:LPS export ABC transporter permease LptF/LPS export ABC transporter permease LptG